MSILVLLSILIRLLNCVLSVLLVRKVRDWRLAFLPLMMILTVLRQTIHFVESGFSRHISWSMPLSEVPGLILSGITFLLILVLERIFSERTQAREALEASLAKYYTAFRASPDAIIIMSRKDGRILEVNEGFSQLFGIPRQEVVGSTSLDLGLWKDPKDRLETRELLDRDGRVQDFESHFLTRSGEIRTCQMSIEVIELEGQPSTLTVMRDITERQRVEDEREAFVEQLEAKNAELERFSYTVSHDLKSPLVTIRGFVGLMQRDLSKGNAVGAARDLKRIDNAAATMGRLLDELLELSRIGRVTHESSEVSVTDLAEEAAELVSASIDESGAQILIGRDLPRVFVDRPRMIEVFQNLLENAVKFRNQRQAPRIDVGVRHKGQELVAFVRDNGLGIEAPYHEKIFGLFDRLDPSIEGTGIGLALVKRIVEVHGGRIWVESEGLGRGSTFCFTLPKAVTQSTAAASPGG